MNTTGETIDCKEFDPLFLEFASDRIWVIDSGYRLVCGNRIFHDDMLAYSGSVINQGDSVFHATTPQTVIDEWKGYYDKVLSEKCRFSVEIQSTINRNLYIEYTFSPVNNINDEKQGVLIIGRDISKTKQKEKELSYSEAKYRAIMEQAAEMLFLHDMDGNIMEVNRAAVERSGYTSEELLGKTVFDIDPDARDRSDKQKIWDQIIASTKQTFEARHIGKSGEIYPVEVTVGKITVVDEQFILALVKDISKRKAAENELLVSEAHNRALFQAIPDMIFLINSEGIFLDFKGPTSELYVDPKVFIGRHMRDILPEKLANESMVYVHNTIKTGNIQQFEYDIDQLDQKKWFECRMVPYADQGVLAMVQDITVRKRLEREIIEREANARTVMEATSDVIILLDRNGIVLDCNDAHAAHLHMTREELIGRDVFSLLPEEVAEKRKAMVGQVLTTGKPIFGEDYRAGFWNQIAIYPIFIQGVQSDYVAVYSRDITRQHFQEQALKASEQKFRTLFENLSEGIFIQDKSGRLIDANDAALTMLGLSREQFLGKDSHDPRWRVINEEGELLIPEQHPSIIALKTGKTLVNQTLGVFVPEKDQYHWLIIDAIPQFSEGNCEPDQVFVYMRDISHRKFAEDSIKHSEGQLKALNATKDKLFSIIAHDLRTPFNGIVGFSELLMHNSQTLDVKEINHYASLIHISAQNTLKLLDNLLNWARLQQDAYMFSPKRLLLYEAVEQALLVPGQMAEQKSISLMNQVEHNRIVVADEQMLNVLLRNLISNAIKFSHPGSEVKVRCKTTESRTEVSVIDQGVGIDPLRIQGLFDISSSVSTRGTANESGTGLGLALCKDIVTRHHGQIWVESSKDAGSCFTFSLPSKTV